MKNSPISATQSAQRASRTASTIDPASLYSSVPAGSLIKREHYMLDARIAHQCIALLDCDRDCIVTIYR